MKSLRPVLWLSGLFLAVSLPAQNFSGSDTFSSILAGQWSAGTTANGGTLTVNGVLDYTDSGVTNATSSAVYDWVLNNGSSAADWSAQIDFTTNLTQVAAQVSIWSLALTSSADANDRFTAEFVRSYMQANPFVRASVTTNGSTGGQQQTDLAGATTMTVRVTFLASSQTITAAYDANGATGGYAFTDLYSIALGAGGQNWGTAGSYSFQLRLQAQNISNATATSAVTTGTFYADNFSAAGTAIPEPATWTGLIGLAALGFVLLRRR